MAPPGSLIWRLTEMSSSAMEERVSPSFLNKHHILVCLFVLEKRKRNAKEIRDRLAERESRLQNQADSLETN